MSQVAADLITQGETEVVGAEHLALGRFAQV